MSELSGDERAELDRLRAAVAAADKTPYLEAAEQAAAGVQQEGQAAAADTGPSLAQMSTAAPEPLPHEAAMDQMMAEFKAMSERVAAMETELGRARTDYAAAAARLGPPAVALYGQAIHDKLVSFRNAHPDAPPGHFDAVIKAAAPLAEASAQVIGGQGHASDVVGQVPDVVDAVDRFINKTHRRKWGKPIDFSALESDLEDAQDAADEVNARAS